MVELEICHVVTPGVGGSQVDLSQRGNGGITFADQWKTSHTLSGIRELCELGLSPAVVTALLTRLIQAHFSDPALIMQPGLRQYIWSPDVTQSKLRITQATQFDPATGQLPALVIKRGPLQSKGLVVNDLNDGAPGWGGTGKAEYFRQIDAQYQVFAIAATDAEAEDLATEVFEFLTYLSPEIRNLPFHDFQVVQQGELGVIEELGNRIGAPVGLRCTYMLGWRTQPVALPIKTLNLTVNS